MTDEQIYNLRRKFPHGGEELLKERARQVEVEGWDAKHDNTHGEGDLVSAAACYLTAAQTALLRDDAISYHSQPPSGRGPAHWPWSSEWWKPSNDPQRNLEKAGALIIAEIERLKRQTLTLYKVYPDSKALGLSDKNRVLAIFVEKSHAEEYGRKKWGDYFKIQTETFNINEPKLEWK